MKTLKWITFFMAVATMSLLTSCSKEDAEKIIDPTGTYKGKITALTEKSDATVVITKTDGNYSLLLEDLKLLAMGVEIVIGNVTITNVVISNGQLSGGDVIPVIVTLPSSLLTMAGLEEPKVTLEVSLKPGYGVVGLNNLVFILVVDKVPVMTKVEVSFDGNK